MRSLGRALRFCMPAGLCLLALMPGKFVFAQNDGNEQKNFTNPILWEDLADLDVIRVGNDYYYSASNMHYSPGAPILHSTDLVHWKYVGHSLPVLDFAPEYDLQGGQAYIRGSWASFLNYRKSNQTFYWGGCIDLKKTYIYTARSAEGPWSRDAVLDHCYYDAGLLIDDDDTMYVAYGNTRLSVAQLSPDGKQEVKSKQIFSVPEGFGMLEGSRFYKFRGNYYILTDRPANAEYVLRSTTGPFGPYEMRKLVLDAASPVAGAGNPHQGGLVQTAAGDWYYMAFIDAYPGGRIPVMAPVSWSADGWPEVRMNGNRWESSYPMPQGVQVSHAASGGNFVDRFTGKSLGPEWEWNHNPDASKWHSGSGLKLQTATVTDDLYQARNTLTHRIPGPVSSAMIELDDSAMKDGDCAGLAMLRDASAWVGLMKENGAYSVVMKSGLTMDKKWNTLSKGEIVAKEAVSAGKIWLRVTADIHPGVGRKAIFSFSKDGKDFQQIGKPFELNANWPFFMGYRYAIFNYATKATGGEVRVPEFRIDMQ